jgi:hemerythrin-like domain-containing protein
MLEDYLNKGIKEVISKFPDVANVLEEYNIGCVPCAVGTCLLKDIIAIHNLSPEDERTLMARIASIIDPDRQAGATPIKSSPQAKPKGIKYSPPLKKLVDEHVLIKRLIGLIPKVIENLDVESAEGRRLVLQSVDLIRSYADKYHHAKEEEILFAYFDENSDMLKTMRQDHERARSHVRAVLEALDKKNEEAIAEHLNAYRELLTEHIRKEDEILYPWMDRNLSVTQVGELFSKFAEAEEKMDKDAIDRCKKFVMELEEEILRPSEEVTK